MKNIFKILFLGFITSLVWSCDKDEDRAVLSNPENSILKTTTNELVLIKENADEEALTLSWENASYGPSLALTNQLEIALDGTNFAAPKTVDLAAGTNSISYTVQAFNALMLNAGLPVDVLSKVQFRLKSVVSNAVDPVYSAPIVMSITPYALISYLYAPGAYQGWNPTTANTLTSATSNGEYIGYIDFTEANSEFKITVNRTWDNAYGSDDNINLLFNQGGNLKSLTAGSQKLVVDLNTKNFTLTPYSWGLIGSATPGGWADDTDMHYDEATKSFVIPNVALTAGLIKFRLNNGWDTNYGGTNGNAVAGGSDIAISDAGNYKVVFDMENLKYYLTKL